MNRFPYFNHSGALNDPDAPEPLDQEQQQAADLAESRANEAAIEAAQEWRNEGKLL